MYLLKKLWKYSFKCDFSKFNESKKNQGVTFLMVPPKDGFAWFSKLNFDNALD